MSEHVVIVIAVIAMMLLAGLAGWQQWRVATLAWELVSSAIFRCMEAVYWVVA